MRKALIFLIAFVCSFMVIYTVYYYKHQDRWLNTGYVANADTLRSTSMRPNPFQPSLQKNIVYSAGIITAMENGKIEFTIGAADIFKNILNPKISTVYAGPYSPAAQEALSSEVLKKDPTLENVKINNIKDGHKLLFAYLFRNLELPPCFTQFAKGMKFGNKEVPAFHGFGPETPADGARFFISKDGRTYGYRMDIANNNNDEEAFWFHKDSLQDIASAWRAAETMMIPENKHALTEGEETVFPMIDMFLEKTYTADEMESYFSLTKNDFKNIVDRIKLKTTMNTRHGNDKNTKAKTQYLFGPSSFFCIKRKSSKFPYVGIIVHNPDIFAEYGKL